jgi:hypothetical protein
MHPGVEPTQCCEFTYQKDSVEDLDMFPKIEEVENITDSESQLPPLLLPMTQTYPSTSAPRSDYIAKPWARDAQGCFEV